MAQQQKVKVKFTSSQGRAQYPWLNQPDTAFGGEPKYKTNLIMDWKDASDLVTLIKSVATASFGEDAATSTKMPFKRDDETGETVFMAKSKYAPYFFDSQGSPLVDKQIPTLWGGSIIRIGGYIMPYAVSGTEGISLQLTKVQVIEPVSGDTDGGFGTVEGGFVGDEILQDAFNATGNQEEAAAAARF